MSTPVNILLTNNEKENILERKKGFIMNIFSRLFHQNTKYYGHVFSLGYNCEVSYQFFRHYRFVESCLFSWVGIKGVPMLINTLEHLEDVSTKGFEYNGSMYVCNASGVAFHGRLTPKESKDLTEKEKISLDTKELQPRIAHLKKKFIETANDGKKTLYIYKPSAYDIENSGNFVNDIKQLHHCLCKLVSNEFDLLVVVEKKFLEELTEEVFASKHIFLRRVNYFNPPQCVTRKPNDRKSWKKIFREFRADFKLTKTKKYKFEQV